MLVSIEDVLDRGFAVNGGITALNESLANGTDVTVLDRGRTLTFRTMGLERRHSSRVMVRGIARNTQYTFGFVAVFDPTSTVMTVVA